MSSFTTRVGLIKPAGTEKKQLTTINNNYDALDAALGTQWVTDGSLPAKQFDGATFKEITSGKTYVLRTDGLGGWVKRNYDIVPYGRWVSIGASLPNGSSGPGTFTPSGDNTLVASVISANAIEFNVPGVYIVALTIAGAVVAGATSTLQLLEIDTGTGITGGDWESSFNGVSKSSVAGIARCAASQNIKLNCSTFYQTGGGTSTANWELRVTKLNYL